MYKEKRWKACIPPPKAPKVHPRMFLMALPPQLWP